MSNNSSFFSKSYGLSNYEIVNAIEIAEKDNEIEILAEGFEWSEGPVWVNELNAILFSDCKMFNIMMFE